MKRQLASIIGKNFKILIRAKASSMVIIFGPLLLVFLAGIAFDHSDPYTLKVGAYAPTYTDTVYDIFDTLRDNFLFSEYSTEDACTRAIRENRIHACAIFSQNFSMGTPGKNDITFITDYSQVNLAGTITTLITQEVGKQSSTISTDLTKELVSAMDYTQEQISAQRNILIRLTTENQIISESAQTLTADLSDIDLRFAPEQLGTTNLTSTKNKIKHWVDNAFNLAQQALSKADNFISTTDGTVGSSDADDDIKEDVRDSLAGSVAKIGQLRDKLQTSEDIAQTTFQEFDTQLTALINGLEQTKTRLAKADESRQLSVRVLDAVLALLDKSLLNLLQVQHTLNNIDERLNALRVTDPSGISQPVRTTIKPIVAETSYLTYIFPSLIILVIMFTSLLIAPLLVLLERHSPAHFRSYMAPAHHSLFFWATITTCMILIAAQLLIMLSIASVLFSTQIISGLPTLILSLTIIALLFIGIGLLIGYLFNSEETAILTGISIGALFLFLGDIIIPLESMPALIKPLAAYGPFVLSTELIRGITIHGSFSWASFSILTGYAIILLSISLFAFGMTRSKFRELFGGFGKLYTYVKKRKPKII